jgi:Na+-driven multidrug efflux pump
MVDKTAFELNGLREYMKVGAPAIAMLCFEWWSYELMTFFAAYISLQAVAV